jgi:hypothetical protein
VRAGRQEHAAHEPLICSVIVAEVPLAALSLYVHYDRDRYSAAEILFARFREGDVQAGKAVSEAAALKNIVKSRKLGMHHDGPRAASARNGENVPAGKRVSHLHEEGEYMTHASLRFAVLLLASVLPVASLRGESTGDVRDVRIVRSVEQEPRAPLLGQPTIALWSPKHLVVAGLDPHGRHAAGEARHAPCQCVEQGSTNVLSPHEHGRSAGAGGQEHR